MLALQTNACITILYVHWNFIGVKLDKNYSATRKSANCSRHHSSAIADKKIMLTQWNSTSAGLSHRADDFNKEISGKTKVRRYERGEKRPVNDLPRLYNREFTAYRRHRCRRETRRKEKKRGERKRERGIRATPPTSHLLRVSSHDVGT